MKNESILVSTTSTLEGYRIIRYIGYIDATSNIGTSFIAEFSADASDLFGDKSYILNNKIIRIKEDAIRQLIRKCIKLGGNAIVGLQIDVDEISSKQRMSLMVSASATAVRVVKKTSKNEYWEMDGTTIKNLIEKSEVIKEIIHGINSHLEAGKINPEDEKNLKYVCEEISLSPGVTGFEDAFIECLMNYISLFSFRESQKFYLKESIQDAVTTANPEAISISFLKWMNICSKDKKKILTLRKNAHYLSLCSIIGKTVPLNTLLKCMENANEYMMTIAVYPLLLEFKEFYTNEDFKSIPEILDHLKSKYYSKTIEITEEFMKNDSRICVDGTLVLKEKLIESNNQETISLKTYKEKLKVIRHLEKVYDFIKINV
ncbi:YbjQ family protein [uncultured Dubosiella sp.]|uniref:YbjQ family protein n=1 Tax=uncultured Dubosiella sp. TaxID=1937011 RepID=UPI00272F7BDF|nr:heavy metal-binding domain-containing protein [uncultured Dubosiella sp.]